MADGTNFVSVIDYIVFASVLLGSLAIGIFYSFKQKTTTEYVHGSHRMGLLPVSLSLVVSFISAITVQGLPAEVYMYGIEVCFTLVGPLGILAINFTFLPIFFELKTTTIYDYLEIRFKSQYPKVLGSILGIATMVIYSGVIMFGPASALESLIGIPTGYNIIIMACICTIYTSIGGIKAVVWTDLFQAIIMFVGITAVLIVGFLNIDKNDIWTSLTMYGRTSLNVNPSLFQRNSVWLFIFPNIISYYMVTCKQSAMVRYTALPTITQARLCSVIGMAGMFLLQALSVLMGVVVFVYYSQNGCGPMAAGKAYTSNQVVPVFLMEVGNYPGIPGLFVSAIVASTLSTVSSAQNSVGTVLWKILFMKINIFKDMSEKRKIVLLKVISLSLGFVHTGIAFGAMYAGGTLFRAATAILSVVSIPPFGMFLPGGCFRFVGSAAAVTGCILTSAFLIWLSLGNLFYGTLWAEPNLINDACTPDFNATTMPYFNETPITNYLNVNSENVLNYSLLKMFSISSYVYPVFALGGTVGVGLFLSIFPCLRHKDQVEERLLIPIVRKFMRKYNKPQKDENHKTKEDIVIISLRLKEAMDVK